VPVVGAPSSGGVCGRRFGTEVPVEFFEEFSGDLRGRVREGPPVKGAIAGSSTCS